MSEPKEPSFFSKKQNLINLNLYKNYFSIPSNLKSKIKVVGEATTAYMVEKDVPGRIRDLLGPNIKFIFLLRDPVNRTISSYWHLYKRFHETRYIKNLFTFESYDEEEVIKNESKNILTALKKGKIRIELYKDRYDDYLWPFRYIANSFYSRNISRYLKYFKRANMLIIFIEKFIESPVQEFQKIEKFLGINDNFLPNNIGEIYNKTYIPKKGTTFKIIHSIANLKINRLLRNKIHFLDNLYKDLVMKEKPQIDKEIINELEKVFKNEKKRLKNL